MTTEQPPANKMRLCRVPQLGAGRVAALSLALLSGCSSATPAPKAAAIARPAITDVERYLPLKHDTVYAYDTIAENTGESGILTMQVTRPRPERADLKVGSRVQRLQFGERGIRYISGGYVLKAPIRPGAEWKGELGLVRVTRVDAQAAVPAGQFVGCIETTEEATSSTESRSVTTVFCPDVGIVSLSVEAVSDDEYVKERAVLKSFGPRVDLVQ